MRHLYDFEYHRTKKYLPMSMRRSHRDYLALPLCLIYNRTGATEMHDVILLYYCGLHMGDSQMQCPDA